MLRKVLLSAAVLGLTASGLYPQDEASTALPARKIPLRSHNDDWAPDLLNVHSYQNNFRT